MRVKGIFKPSDYDGEATDDLAALFAALAPGVTDPEIDENHAGVAIAAQNPKLALMLSQLSRHLALDTGWAKRTDLRELAIQTVNLHYGSDYGWRTRLAAAYGAGIDDAMLDALRAGHPSPLFSKEQQLTIDYARAVVTGTVPDTLFARVVDAWGEQGVVECTSVIGLWSFWAMLLGATRPD